VNGRDPKNFPGAACDPDEVKYLGEEVSRSRRFIRDSEGSGLSKSWMAGCDYNARTIAVLTVHYDAGTCVIIKES